MDERSKLIIDQMGALGQDTRFRVFRALMSATPDGIPAGELATQLDILPSTLSTHLAILSRADLVSYRREGRTLFYAANIESVRGMLEHLVSDCCDGHADLCERSPPLQP